MEHNPTDRAAFDAAALTTDQRNGVACVVCSSTTAVMRPVGILNGGQIFACASHDGDEAAEGDAGLRERAARRATWPGGEVASVRHAADVVVEGDAQDEQDLIQTAAEGIVTLISMAPRYAKLADEVRADGHDQAADAVDAVRAVLGELAAVVHDDGGDVWRVLPDVERVMAHARRIIRASRTSDVGDVGDVS